MALAEALVALPPAERGPFLKELMRATSEMVDFFEAFEEDFAPEPEAPPVPNLIGRFEVIRLIGEGTMGKVYQARDPIGDQVVAIKTMHRSLLRQRPNRDRFRRRFAREARIYGKLRHENIVALIEYAEEPRPYIVMEYVAGETLAALMSRAAELSWPRISAILTQVCQALSHAHHASVIHRDLKPANILLASGGQVKLTDFGISKLLGDRTLTNTGFLGTPIYAAPEQVTGTPITLQTDLYALALLIHQMVTGCHPFRGESLEQTLFNIANKEPKLAEPFPLLEIEESGFRQFMTKALAKQPASRFPDADVFYTELCRHCRPQ